MEQRKNNKIKIFDYIEELDCFKPTKKYSKIAERLSIAEWNPVVWIGRYFTMDNDYGGHWFDNWEHWFDNWDEREGFREKAEKLGYRMDELLILVSERFKDGEDGPVHPSEMRESFWRDVLSSL